MGLMPVGFPAISIGGNTAPPSPYYDWGACPFECCTYREWTANALTEIHKDKQESSPVSFRVNRNEKVQGITGVVVTTEPGRTKVLKPVILNLDENKSVKLKSGDIFYNLHYLGEGNDLLWYGGKTFGSDQFVFADTEPYNSIFQDLNEPTNDWWVKIRNSTGMEGWTNQTKHFDHMDACE
jgi:hypothetical protein